jgi:hypothetical protein
LNLKWNPDFRRFEVEFHNFADEQPRVKEAGFKCDGPPSWVWWSIKSEPLTKLRENRPAVLNINADARVEYTRLKEVEDRNAATKAALKEHQKELKKKLKLDKQIAAKPGEYFDKEVGFVCLKVEPKPSKATKFVSPPPPETRCFICGVPVYSYEYGEGQTPCCLWDQKTVLDNATEVC